MPEPRRKSHAFHTLSGTAGEEYGEKKRGSGTRAGSVRITGATVDVDGLRNRCAPAVEGGGIQDCGRDEEDRGGVGRELVDDWGDFDWLFWLDWLLSVLSSLLTDFRRGLGFGDLSPLLKAVRNRLKFMWRDECCAKLCRCRCPFLSSAWNVG